MSHRLFWKEGLGSTPWHRTACLAFYVWFSSFEICEYLHFWAVIFSSILSFCAFFDFLLQIFLIWNTFLFSGFFKVWCFHFTLAVCWVMSYWVVYKSYINNKVIISFNTYSIAFWMMNVFKNEITLARVLLKFFYCLLENKGRLLNASWSVLFSINRCKHERILWSEITLPSMEK